MQEISIYGKLAKKQPEICLVDMQHCFIYKAVYKSRRMALRKKCTSHMQENQESLTLLSDTRHIKWV